MAAVNFNHQKLPDLQLGYFENVHLGQPTSVIEEEQFKAAVWEELPAVVDARITSDPANRVVRSWKDYGPPKKEFAYVQVTHLNMSMQPVTGEVVIHRTLAEDVVGISGDLFKAQFPIEQQRLIDYWDADDEASMSENNSSALCVRAITAGSTLSNHALGRAWDINTRWNPYINLQTGLIAPANGKEFVDRTLKNPGMIQEGDAVTRAFKTRGWEWGGDWTSRKDYQHFQKV